MISSDPGTLYPNSVADALVGRLLAEMSADVSVEQYGKDLFQDEEGLLVHPSAYKGVGVFVNAEGPTPLDKNRPGLVEHRWDGRLRIAHHNPRSELEQHQEALVYVERAVSAVQGWKVPVGGVDGVEGGERIVETAAREQVINVPNFAAYRVPISLNLYHKLQ